MIYKKFIFAFILALLFGIVFVESLGGSPLTGILKEGGEELNFSKGDVSFFMGEKTIYKLRDVSFSLDFFSNLNRKNKANVEFWVHDSSGEVVFYDEDFFYVKGNESFELDLDRRSAQGIELEEGEYLFTLKVDFLGKTHVFSREFYLREISDFLYSLKQLFDIRMEIDNKVLDDSEDLQARVIFESFGSEPTPVNMTFFIYDLNDEEFFRKDVSLVVETEGVYIESFDNFNYAPAGNYSVVLRTVYNVDIEDYFEQKIEIREGFDFFPFIVLFVFVFFGGIVLYRKFKKKK